jgi:hypothetical protein
VACSDLILDDTGEGIKKAVNLTVGHSGTQPKPSAHCREIPHLQQALV